MKPLWFEARMATLLTTAALSLGALLGCGESVPEPSPGDGPGVSNGNGVTSNGGSAGMGQMGAGGDSVVAPGDVTQVVGIDPPGMITPGAVGPVSGGIAQDTLWGPGDVQLTGDVTIAAGATLTINPGTHVTGAFAIRAEGGTFKCEGYFNAPSTLFEANIVLNGGQHAMQYCSMNSVGDVAIDVNDAELSAYHLQIQRFNTAGVYVHGPTGRVAIDFSTLGSHSKLFTLDDATQEGVSVLIAADAAQNGSSIENSVLGFLDNASNTGLKIEGGVSNTRLAYLMISGPNATVATSDVTEVYRGMAGVTDIPNLDYRLNFFSPSLDLANPNVDSSLEPTPNGGRANLGYYGGTPEARITSVQIISPNGCEEIAAGTQQTVRWRSSPNTGPKTLEFSADNGGSWAVLANITEDTGSAEVTFPDVMTDQALLRFSQDNDPAAIMDVSNRVFAIGLPKSEAACSAKIRCPAGTEDCKYFKVICYTGYRDGQMPTGQPGTEPSYEEVLEDLQIMAPYTRGIRTYGSGPLTHGSYVPGITDMLGLDLHMGVWVDDSYSEAQNMQSLDDALALVQAGHPSIRTLIVGNEFLLRVRQSFGDTEAAQEKLTRYVQYVRARAPQEIEVVTAESYPDWLEAPVELFDAVDRVIWHVHPWWQQHTMETAVGHVENARIRMQERMQELGVTKPDLLGETGYPWDVCNGPNACGTEAIQGQYLEGLHDLSGQIDLEYWFFEGFDENWKDAEGAVGGKWGIWKADRTPHPLITGIASLIDDQEMWGP